MKKKGVESLFVFFLLKRLLYSSVSLFFSFVSKTKRAIVSIGFLLFFLYVCLCHSTFPRPSRRDKLFGTAIPKALPIQFAILGVSLFCNLIFSLLKLMWLDLKKAKQNKLDVRLIKHPLSLFLSVPRDTVSPAPNALFVLSLLDKFF